MVNHIVLLADMYNVSVSSMAKTIVEDLNEVMDDKLNFEGKVKEKPDVICEDCLHDLETCDYTKKTCPYRR